MRFVCALLLLASSLAAQDNKLTSSEAAQGWLLLFDGESLFGWTQAGKARWHVAAPALTADGGEGGWLRTNSAFADYIFKCDLRIGADTDAALFLRAEKKDLPDESGYKLPIGVGIDAGRWHTYELQAVGDQISIVLDGRKISESKDLKNKAGYIYLSYNRGSRVEFRNVKLRPLSMQPLLNGRNLFGWKPVNPPDPKAAKPQAPGLLKKFGHIIKPPKSKEPASWTVVNGGIHVEKGPGRLETETAYDDFVLQLDIRASSRDKKEHPNGGVFFRGDPNVFESGYETQIENEYKAGNPSQPLEFGTGGIYNFQPARRVITRDNETFTETIVARGKHFATWINGYPMADYEDNRPDAPAVPKGARTAAGTISLQVHDPSTELDVKNIRLATLPKSASAPPAPVAAAAAPVANMPGPGGAPAPNVPAPAAAAPPVSAPAMPNLPAAGFSGAPAPPAGGGADARLAQITQLMAQGLATQDPEAKVKIYTQILLLDPNNQVAYNARKDAEEALEKQNAAKNQQATQSSQKLEDTLERETVRRQSLQKVEQALLTGDIKTASAQMALAKQAAPNDPEVQRLDKVVGNLIEQKRRTTYLFSGAGLLVLLGLGAIVFLNRGEKDPYIEILNGLDKGRRYNLDKEVIRIGAVAQDGGEKNDIVVTDLERAVSRFHCDIVRQSGKFYLLDRKSANGTYIDGQRIPPGKPVRLKTGARVELGKSCALRLGMAKRKKK